MRVPTLRCQGECGKKKFLGLFAPNQQKRARPVCIVCCQSKQKNKYAIRSYTKSWYTGRSNGREDRLARQTAEAKG